MKLWIVKKDKAEFYVLAWNFDEAVSKWRGSSVAYTKADPDSVSLAVDDIIGAPTKKVPAPKGWDKVEPGGEVAALESIGMSAESLGLLPAGSDSRRATMKDDI